MPRGGPSPTRWWRCRPGCRPRAPGGPDRRAAGPGRGGTDPAVRQVEFRAGRQRVQRAPGDLGLELAHVGAAGKELAVEIVQGDPVVVHQPQGTRPGAHQVLRHHTAHAAHAEDGHAGRGDPRLEVRRIGAEQRQVADLALQLRPLAVVGVRVGDPARFGEPPHEQAQDGARGQGLDLPGRHTVREVFDGCVQGGLGPAHPQYVHAVEQPQPAFGREYGHRFDEPQDPFPETVRHRCHRRGLPAPRQGRGPGPRSDARRAWGPRPGAVPPGSGRRRRACR